MAQVKFCHTCKWRFGNVCNWHQRFLKVGEQACLDYAKRPLRPSPDHVWHGSQIQWRLETQSLFTTEQAARYLGLSASAVRYHVYAAGDLEPRKMGNSLVFTKAQLDAFKLVRRGRGRPRKENKVNRKEFERIGRLAAEQAQAEWEAQTGNPHFQHGGRDSVDEFPYPKGIHIDLTGPDGNAFYLMGLAGKLAEQLDKDGDEIVARMKESDYEHLLAVFEEEFGEHVILYKDDTDA